MITEIPTASEFRNAGLNQIYLAWQIAIQTAGDYEEAKKHAVGFDEEEAEDAASNYWLKSQPVLANAFGLAQQAMEMALKGRIADISPYLLIGRDPKDWPAGADKRPVPFSEFRTLDAADLVKVHNTFSKIPLDEEFRHFWDALRRDRNKLMHSVSTQRFNPALLIRSILTAVETLFSDVKWPQRLIAMESDGKYKAYGFDAESEYNVVMYQIGIAVRHLTPADNKRFFGFDEKRRAYLCPVCWQSANRDWMDEWPRLAQLSSKQPGDTSLFCIVCDEATDVDRVDCTNPHCKGNVIYDGMCLTCLSSQDSPDGFLSGLADDSLGLSHCYNLHFEKKGQSRIVQDNFATHTVAIEHCRRALEAPHLQSWESVTIRRPSLGFEKSSLGRWVRESGRLVWQAEAKT